MKNKWKWISFDFYSCVCVFYFISRMGKMARGKGIIVLSGRICHNSSLSQVCNAAFRWLNALGCIYIDNGVILCSSQKKGSAMTHITNYCCLTSLKQESSKELPAELREPVLFHHNTAPERLRLCDPLFLHATKTLAKVSYHLDPRAPLLGNRKGQVV